MPQSFDVGHDPLVSLSPERRRVLVTGARGHIGSHFAEHTYKKYQLRLMVQDLDGEAERLRRYGEVVQGDLGDLQRLKDLSAGIDTVVHLAADPDPSATWDSVLPNNIIGTYNMMVAATSAHCRRLIFASSIHAVSGYPPDVQVKASDPVNPGDLYGVSKCFGEALGRYSDARALLGYEPRDDLTSENPELARLHLRDTVTAAEERSAMQADS